MGFVLTAWEQGEERGKCGVVSCTIAFDLQESLTVRTWCKTSQYITGHLTSIMIGSSCYCWTVLACLSLIVLLSVSCIGMGCFTC